MKRFVAAIALTIGLFIGGIGTAAFADTSDSVGALYNRTYDNSLRFTCTVSALDWDSPDKTMLLTASHCISETQKHYLVTFDNITFHNAELYMVPRALPDDPKVDMALLIMPKIDVPKLKVDISENVKSGTDIVTVGFPLGIAKLLYKGYIAGRVDNLGSETHDYLILQTFGAPGSSGTSVIDEKTGKIIGVLVAASGGGIGLPVIYATPISYLKYLATPKDKRKLHREFK